MTTDPLEVLRLAQRHCRHEAPGIEAALAAAELRAVDSAPPTPGLRTLLRRLSEADIPVAVVTNNSAATAARWLDRTGLSDVVARVQVRQPDQLENLKPQPALVTAAGG